MTFAHWLQVQADGLLSFRTALSAKDMEKSPSGTIVLPPSEPSPDTKKPVPSAGAMVFCQSFVHVRICWSNASEPSCSSTGAAFVLYGIENTPAPFFTILEEAASARGTAPSQLQVGTSTVRPFAPTTKFVTPEPAPPNHSVAPPSRYGMSVAPSNRTRFARAALVR